jgi:hypothetical protein
LLVRDGHYNTNWDEEDGADSKGKKKTIPWEMDRVAENVSWQDSRKAK